MPGDILFSCSTYFDTDRDPWRFEKLVVSLKSILWQHPPQELERIDRFLIINEWADVPAARLQAHAARVAEHLPWATFVQKTAPEQGQARTLNLILAELAGYTYWLHWEETWRAVRPFLRSALAVMEHAPQVTQLQLSTDALADAPRERMHALAVPGVTDIVQLIDPPATMTWGGGEPAATWWPLYSLRPSINRAAFCAGLGKFNEDRALWPVRFEWDYARRWVAAGGRKALFADPPVRRLYGHVSTYG